MIILFKNDEMITLMKEERKFQIIFFAFIIYSCVEPVSVSLPAFLVFFFQTLFASLALCNKHQIHFCSHLSQSQSFKDLIVSIIIHLLLFLKLHIFPFLINSQKSQCFYYLDLCLLHLTPMDEMNALKTFMGHHQFTKR